MKLKEKLDEKLPVLSITYTIQSDGFMMGTPATIIKLQGNPFITETETENKEKKAKAMSYDEILDKVKNKFIVITGEEPCTDGVKIKQLLNKLKNKGKIIAIETSGAFQIPSGFDWVTVIPKRETYKLVADSGIHYQEFAVLKENWVIADEFKIFVDESFYGKIDKILEHIFNDDYGISKARIWEDKNTLQKIWLQPDYKDIKNIKRSIKEIVKYLKEERAEETEFDLIRLGIPMKGSII